MGKKIGFKVMPKKKTEVIDYHLVHDGKKWIKRLGLLKMIVVYRKPEDIIGRIEDLFREVNEKVSPKHSKKRFKINNLLICKHKLYAVKYHLDNFKNEEEA